MMNNNPYKIDYIKNTITASKKFLKAASVYGSTEYKTMIQLRTDFPTFTFEEKQITQKKGKQSYGVLRNPSQPLRKNQILVFGTI